MERKTWLDTLTGVTETVEKMKAATLPVVVLTCAFNMETETLEKTKAANLVDVDTGMGMQRRRDAGLEALSQCFTVFSFFLFSYCLVSSSLTDLGQSGRQQ